jgi:hypothetical protein
MNLFLIRAAVAAVVLCSGVAFAQSLADVARREEARRKAVAGSGKVYTNDGLEPAPPSTGSVPVAPAAPAPAPGSTPAAGSPAAPGAPVDPAAAAAAPLPKTEAEWRKRVTTERDALSRAQIFAEALQSRINVLSADFVNRDDPAQRNQVAAERTKALAELDRVKQEIQQHQKAITTIQDEARRAGVPAGWVR